MKSGALEMVVEDPEGVPGARLVESDLAQQRLGQVVVRLQGQSVYGLLLGHLQLAVVPQHHGFTEGHLGITRIVPLQHGQFSQGASIVAVLEVEMRQW